MTVHSAPVSRLLSLAFDWDPEGMITRGTGAHPHGAGLVLAGCTVPGTTLESASFHLVPFIAATMEYKRRSPATSCTSSSRPIGTRCFVRCLRCGYRVATTRAASHSRGPCVERRRFISVRRARRCCRRQLTRRWDRRRCRLSRRQRNRRAPLALAVRPRRATCRAGQRRTAVPRTALSFQAACKEHRSEFGGHGLEDVGHELVSKTSAPVEVRAHSE